MIFPPDARRRIPPAALFSTLFLVYRLFPDALSNFDGLMFSGIISERAPGWRTELFRYGAHFLFNPLAWLAHRLCASLTPGIPGYASIQIMNAALGAGAVLLLTGLGVRVTRSRAVALPLGLLAAHGWLFWGRAAECSVYMPALFAETVVFLLLWEHHRRPTAGRAALLGAATGAATLFHLAGVFWFPAVALFVLMKDRRLFPVFLAAAFAAGAVPQILAYRIFSVEGLVRWYRHMGSASAAVWGAGTGSYWTRRLSLGRHPAALFQLLWAWPPEEARWGLLPPLLTAFAGLAGAAVRWGSRLTRASLASHAPLLAFLAMQATGVLLLQTVWAFELTKYAALVPTAFLAAALLARAARARRDRAFVACLWLLWAGTFAYNLQAAAIPRSRFDRNGEFIDAQWTSRVTPPGSLIVASGLAFSLGKLYLTGFAGRGLLSLADVFITRPPGEGLAEIERLLRQDLGAGVPVYVLSELSDGAVFSGLPDAWGASAEDVRALFRRFEFQEITRRDRSHGVSRLWPRGAPADYWREAAARAREDGRRREEAYARRRSDEK